MPDLNRRATDDINEARARRIAAYAAMSPEQRQQDLYEMVVSLSLQSDQQPARCLAQKEECFEQFKDLVGAQDTTSMSLGPAKFSYAGKKSSGMVVLIIVIIVIGILIALAIAPNITAWSK